MRIEGDHLSEIRHRLLGPGSRDLIRLMHSKSLGSGAGSISQGAARIAGELGWLEDSSGELTDQGRYIADACREYTFWLERDRALPFEGAAPHLSPDYFRDRSVLEIGAGMGVNLMTFAAAGVEVCGVEPVEAYAQLGAILCEREGLSVPTVRQGSAEALPFPDDQADAVLCVSAHQYFDMRSALAEIYRVLKPQGEIIIIGATAHTYLWGGLIDLIRQRSGFRDYSITAINTISYTAVGQRIVPSRGDFTTSRPIYLSQRTMGRLFLNVGLRMASPICRVGSETCFHARLGRPEGVEMLEIEGN